MLGACPGSPGTSFCVPDWRRDKLSDKSEQVLREAKGFFRGLVPQILIH